MVHADALYRPVPPVEYDDEGYPGPDSRVSESTRHAEASNYAFDALRVWFRDPAGHAGGERPRDAVRGRQSPGGAVAGRDGDYRRRQPRPVVVQGVGGGDTRCRRSRWRFSRARTWRKDIRVKPGLYAALGVREFWLFEPFVPHLAGHRLGKDGYRRIRPLRGRAASGVRCWAWMSSCRTTGCAFGIRSAARILPDHLQSAAMRVEAERRLEQQAAARREAEEARREADRQRDREAEARREADRQRDREAEARREAEQRAARAERRAAELEARLKGSR